jgi:hypothetical protein
MGLTYHEKLYNSAERYLWRLNADESVSAGVRLASLEKLQEKLAEFMETARAEADDASD